jgi:predicted transcriptional regulator of viral defense system
MDILSFFDQNPVFTHDEFVRFLVSQGTINLRTQRGILAYHLKKQHIVRVRRGLFGSIPISFWNSAQTYPIDPYLIAGRITEDAVLAYHTAFDFHGLSYSVYNRFTFMSQQKIRPFAYQSSFICLAFPQKLIEQSKTDFEVTTVDRQGLNIKITSLERTLVDVLDRPNYAGGWEEIWRSAAHIPILNLKKVIEYAFLLNNATTIAKLGFFLEQHKEIFTVDDHILTTLEEKIPSSIHYLERNKRESGKLIKRWNLVVPHSVIERTWEEPNNDLI